MLDLVIDGEKYSFPKGMELSEIFSKTDLPNNRFVAAVVENELVRLDYIPENDIEITSISRGEELGNRIYRRSLFLLLAKAVYELFPDSRLKIEHSLSNGIYCELFKGEPLTRHDLKKIKIKMNKYVEQDLSIKKEYLEKEKLIETMKGTEVRVSAEWLENNNPYLLEKIYNSSYFTRGLDYKPPKEDILAQLNFTDTGICVKATHKGVSGLLDEQTWWTDSYDDWTLERLKSYRLGY